MVEQISDDMKEESFIVSSDTGGRAYPVGDLMTLSNLLSGLISVSYTHLRAHETDS